MPAILTRLLHLTATILLYTVLAAVVLKILRTDAYKDFGILALKFNFTEALLDVIPSPTHSLSDRNLLGDLHDGVRSALDAAATSVTDAASQAGSAISSAADIVQAIEEISPRNCSLGTRRFCIGYKHNTNCSNLPLNFSSLLPAGVQKLPSPLQDAIHDRAEALSQLAESSTRFPPLSVPNTLISGLALMSIVAAVSLSLGLTQPQVITKAFGKLRALPKALVLLGLGLMSCSPFVLLAVILNTILRAAHKLPSWVGVDVGPVRGLAFTALAFALVLALIFPAAPSIAVHTDGEDAKQRE